ALRVATISFGVPDFTAKPTQSSTTRLGNPASTMVGTSFIEVSRFGPVTASARNLPDAISSTTGSVVMNMNWLVPLSRSAIDCGNWLYGTWVAFTPVSSLNISPIRCAGVPKPPEEKFSLSGLALSSATSSETDFAATPGYTTSTL